MSSKEEKARRDTHWGAEGLLRLNRLAKQEGRSGAEIARQALVNYEVDQSYFRDIVRGATLQLFQTLVVQEHGGYGDPAHEEASPADEAMAFLGSLLNSIYAAQGIREAFERVLDQNRMTGVEVPPAQSSDLCNVPQQQGLEHYQAQESNEA